MKIKIVAFLLLIGTFLSLPSCKLTPQNIVTNQGEQTEQVEQDEQTKQNEQVEYCYPKVTIKEPCIYVFAGSSYSLSYDLGETDGTKESKINWYSSTDCVSVDENGTVTAKKEGYSIVSGNGGNGCTVCIIPKNMPALSVNTDGVAIDSQDIYTACKISLDTDNSEYSFSEASAGIRIRGNSTAKYAKKPYRIKLDAKRNVLGLNGGAECKSWVLLAEYRDDSLLRNATCLTLASMILDEYSSDWRYVNVYINGIYNGVYVLCEQSQINKNRINIEEAGADSTNLLSGYLFEMDYYEKDNADENSMFKIYTPEYSITDINGNSYAWNHLHLYYTLKNDGYSEDQFLFSKYYLRAVFHIIYNATYNNKAMVFKCDFLKDPSQAEAFLAACKLNNEFKTELVETTELTPREAIEKVVDIESLSRMYIFSEMVCNSDDRYKSFFCWVDFSEGNSGKLMFGCPWDHDGTFVEWGTYNYRPTNEYFAAVNNPWYTMIMRNSWFADIVKEDWKLLYKKNNGFKSVVELIPQISSTYNNQFMRESSLWNRKESQPYHSNKTKEWLKERIAWMNSTFGS